MSAPEPQKLTDEKAAEVVAAIERGDAIVCYAKCWPCQFGQHFDPTMWHTWADGEDVQHARNTGQPDPSKSRCGCWCAEVRS